MSDPSTPQWTPAQQDAIRHVDGALLVSAAAGSGKTAVLAERCAYLVCDAPEPCDVDELLVLTFTRAAAAEMRSRIDQVIRRHAAKEDAPARIQRQLRLIDRASITTLDAFCGAMVRSHFHLVGVDPGFTILAAEDAALMKNDLATQLIDAEYDGPDATPFRTLLDSYFASNDDDLRASLQSAHALMQSIVDPAAWTAQALQHLEDTSAGTALMRDYQALQQRELRAAIRRLEQAARLATSFELASYADHAHAIRTTLEDWLAFSEAGRLDDLAAQVAEYKLPRAPTVKKDAPGKDDVKAEIDEAKERLKSGGAVRRLCVLSESQLRHDLQVIAPLAAYFLGLVDRFGKAYDAAKQSARALDFADTERLALKVLTSDTASLVPSQAAIDLQRRFRHVLVDEYQDINPLQNAILRLVSRDRRAELAPESVRSNFFTVGDVKQSIYGFRLAEPQQFITRQSTLEEPFGRVITLQENFRSRAPLLDAVNDIFRLLMTRQSAGIDYDSSHELRSLRDYPPIDNAAHFTGKPIELHVLPRKKDRSGDDHDADDEESPDSFEREVDYVARRIREMVCDDESKRPRVMTKGPFGLTSRPIRYGDIAVLLRTRRIKSSQTAEALRRWGIPVLSDDATGFFSAVEVQDILSVLRVLSNRRQDVALAALIRSPLSPVREKEDALAAIRIACPDEPFHTAVARYTAGSDELARELRALLEQLAQWRRMFQEQSVGESLRHIYEYNGYLTFCRALPDGAQRVANLQELQKRGEAFDFFERQGLDRFLAFLEELEENDELGRPSLATGDTDVVRVMTVHKSKGLEFPVVFIPDLGKRFNEASLASPILLDRDAGVGMAAVDLKRRVRYPSAASAVVRDAARRKAVAEEIRVLYVAFTRAREHLVLVGSAGKDAMKKWTANWGSHQGPLPDESVQDASTALDWIGPIAAITQARGLDTFAVHDRTSDDADKDVTPHEKPPARPSPPTLLTSDRLDDADAQLAVKRIEFVYPHRKMTTHASTLRPTDFVRETLPGIAEPRRIELPWPIAYKPILQPRATDIGSAMHRLLQFIDFHETHTAADIDRQIDALIVRHLLSEADAKLVDRPAIEWFLSTPIAEQIRQPDARLIREQSLAASVSVGKTDGDFALLRGRVDAVIVRPAGLFVVDYKSDRVSTDQVNERAARYAMQVHTYVDAMERLTGRRVIGAALVFLHPRRIADVPLDGKDQR